MKEFTLPSGAELRVTLAPFKDGKELWSAIAVEMKSLRFDDDQDVNVDFFKNLFCAGISSPLIEKALGKCMARATYNGSKITDEIFEDEEARQDYFEILFLVAKVNIDPFAKGLFVKFSQLFQKMKEADPTFKLPKMSS